MRSMNKTQKNGGAIGKAESRRQKRQDPLDQEGRPRFDSLRRSTASSGNHNKEGLVNMKYSEAELVRGGLLFGTSVGLGLLLFMVVNVVSAWFYHEYLDSPDPILLVLKTQSSIVCTDHWISNNAIVCEHDGTRLNIERSAIEMWIPINLEEKQMARAQARGN